VWVLEGLMRTAEGCVVVCGRRVRFSMSIEDCLLVICQADRAGDVNS
jgi:hypothetical protein